MRRSLSHKIERCRVRSGRLATTTADGFNGAFLVRHPNGATLTVIASDGRDWAGLPGEPWEHVSVSTMVRCPSYEEMDWIKRQFWGDDETVMQLHVPRSAHINLHEFCLHLWKPPYSIPLPPPECVGVAKQTTPSVTRTDVGEGEAAK